MIKSEVDTVDTSESFSKLITNYYISAGLEYRDPIGLLPESIDRSVTFTSATINGMKPYLKDRNTIPEKGIFTIQPCLRTQNLDHRYDSVVPKFGSYFNMFGSLYPADKLGDVYGTTIDFVNRVLDVPKESIIVHKSSKQKIFNLLKDQDKAIQWRENEIDWYDWTYGEDNIRGIGITVDIPNKLNTEKTQEIGNIVLILKNNEPIAIEWGFGLETTQSRLQGLPHPIFASTLGEKYSENKGKENFTEKDVLFLDYLNILFQLDKRNFSINHESKYVRRTIKQLFQGLTMQMLYGQKDWEDIINLVGPDDKDLIYSFKSYYLSFMERFYGLRKSYQHILNNNGIRRNQEQIQKTYLKSAKNFGFFDKQAEAIIKFLESRQDEE